MPVPSDTPAAPADDLDGPPLQGVRILDFTRYISGPYATMLLADAGAEVIKVEPIGGEVTRELDPMIDSPSGRVSGYFHRLNRSKRSAAIDITTAAGREVVLRLVPAVDVVVENFRPGVMQSLGLGFETLRATHPRLVYCSISGYGHSVSPHRDDPAFAILAEVSAGVVAGGLRPDDPPGRLPAPLGDLYPASLAVGGIAMALWKRERTGRGSHVDMAMFDALVSLNENAIGMSATTGTEMLPAPDLSYAAPFGIFRADDGYLCIAVLGEKVWRRFCVAIGRPDLGDDRNLGSGERRAEAMKGELRALIDGWLMGKTRDQAVALLVAQGVPSGPVQTPHQIIESDQVAARQLLWEVPSYSGAVCRLVGSPIRIGGPDGFAPVGPVPSVGRDTAAVLAELAGLGPDDIAALAAAGTIGVAPPP